MRTRRALPLGVILGLFVYGGSALAWDALGLPSPLTVYRLIVQGPSALNGDLYVFGDAGVTKNASIAGTMEVGGVSWLEAAVNATLVDAGNVVLPTTGKVKLDGPGGSVNVAYGGSNTVQFGDSAANTIAFTGAFDNGTTRVRGGLANDTSGAACSSNTGSVCVNDTGGLCWTNGSGTTVGCLTAAGLITSSMKYDWTFNAFASVSVAAGTGTFSKGAASGAAATVIGGNFTPHVIGVGAGNFVTKLCDDAACTTTYLTCTVACTAAVLTPVACTVGTSAYTAGKTPFWNITTACATTNPVGMATAGFTQP